MTSDIANALHKDFQDLDTSARALWSAAEKSAEALSRLVEDPSGGRCVCGGDPESEDLVQDAARKVRDLAKANADLAGAFEEVAHQWFRLTRLRLQNSADSLHALVRCRSANEFVTLQTEQVLSTIRRSAEDSRRLAMIAMRMSSAGTRPIDINDLGGKRNWTRHARREFASSTGRLASRAPAAQQTGRFERDGA